ncbi:MAG: hypothetical protein AAF467_05685 [Actinomycetota bacterium]
MSRRRKTNHHKPRPKPGRTQPARPHQASVVLTLIDDNGDLINIDITNDPDLADLVTDLTADCPHCNGHESEHQ